MSFFRMSSLIIKGFGPDQIFIKGVAEVREVEASKDTMPVGIVALGLIQIPQEVLVPRMGPLLTDLLPEMQHPFVKIVRFRIFGKEVSPESPL